MAIAIGLGFRFDVGVGLGVGRHRHRAGGGDRRAGIQRHFGFRGGLAHRYRFPGLVGTGGKTGPTDPIGH